MPGKPASPALPPHDLDTLRQELRAGLEALYGDRLAELVLFGSHARGEAGEDSDVDVLVVLHGEVRPAAEIRRMRRLGARLSVARDTLVSLIPVAESEYRTTPPSFLRHARSEGVSL